MQFVDGNKALYTGQIQIYVHVSINFGKIYQLLVIV